MDKEFLDKLKNSGFLERYLELTEEIRKNFQSQKLKECSLSEIEIGDIFVAKDLSFVSEYPNLWICLAKTEKGNTYFIPRLNHIQENQDNRSTEIVFIKLGNIHELVEGLLEFWYNQ